MKVKKIDILAVLDTGAEVTVIRDGLFRDLPCANDREISVAKCNLIVAGEGHQMESKGLVNLDLNLGGNMFPWDIYLAPIADDMLLGCDIIDKLDLTLNTTEGMEMNTKWIPCEVNRRINSIAHVQLKESVNIPGNSEFLSACKIVGDLKTTGQFATMEPMFEELGDLMMARAVVDTLSQTVQIRFINLSGSPVVLERDQPVAEHCDFDLLLVAGLPNKVGWPTPKREGHIYTGCVTSNVPGNAGVQGYFSTGE